MNSASIEFGKSKADQLSSEIIRKSFRVPVDDKKNIGVVIQNRAYPIEDISPEGISVLFKEKPVFASGQIFTDCELVYFQKRVRPLKGRVVHVSTAYDDGWKCGIQWVEQKKENSEAIFAMVAELKAGLIKKETLSPDEG